MSEGEFRELALFAGAGGGILGGILCGFRTICAVENEPYCREVLLRRQRDGVLPVFPIWDDVRSFDGRPWRGAVDIVTAGFPCQPYSAAGKRRGASDERNLWPDTIRILREVEPGWALLENVPHLLAHDYFGEILGSLAEAGFDAEWDVVSAAECGAWHLRERLWIVAHAHGRGRARRGKRGAMEEPALQGADEEHADTDDDGERARACQRPLPDAVGDGGGKGLEESDVRGRDANLGKCNWWDAEPGVGRVVHGLAHRIRRIRALGNGQVPRVAQEAWLRLTAQKERR